MSASLFSLNEIILDEKTQVLLLGIGLYDIYH